ncbi:hypothetical protein EYF80_044394 [Liparis tanakae]|uniref:Uncharacterized protein n=1 Tax=Liparis tanakae TaxID=230148 RepID=A0A4Z2FW02_9TELE|nr:hypothetical protein EYF80_044394 [Liparis tanakae]
MNWVCTARPPGEGDTMKWRPPQRRPPEKLGAERRRPLSYAKSHRITDAGAPLHVSVWPRLHAVAHPLASAH